MVGVFYRAPQPGARRRSSRSATSSPPGQTLCLLEAMKLFNELKADADGRRAGDPRRERRSRSSSATLLFELEPVGAPPVV